MVRLLQRIVEAKGFAASVVGPLFAKIYRGNLEKAIPLLVAEWEF